MKIEKVANLAVQVFVPYTISILVETQEDEANLRTAAQRIKIAYTPTTQKLGYEILRVMKDV